MSTTMKRVWNAWMFVGLSSLAGLSGHAADARVDADSKITAVTVYNDRALVGREAKLNLPQGQTTVVFSKLPIGLDDRSTRATALDRGVKIVGIESRQVRMDKATHPKLALLQQQIETAQDEMKGLSDTMDLVKSKKEFLESLKAAKADKASKEMIGKPGSDLKDWTEMMTFINTGLQAISKERRQTEIAMRDLKKKLEVMEFEARLLASGGQEHYKEVRVTVDAAAAGMCVIRVQYVIGGASWNPLYDARVLSQAGKVELLYYGVVSQRTGEDWSDIDLILSTARPAAGGQLASLDPWVLTVASANAPASPGYAQNEMARKMSAKSAQMGQNWTESREQSAGEARDEKDTMIREVRQEGGHHIADAETSTTAVFFAVKKKETIPSDGQPHQTAIAADTFQAKFEYEAAPVLSAFTFFKAKLTNGENPLLAGAMNVFLDQDYVGTSAIKTTQAGEIFDASFGVDEGVKVERKLEKKEQREDRNFMSGVERQRTLYSWKMSVQNFKKVPVTFTLKDRLPVSTHEDVVISNIRVEPEPTERTPKGLVRWAMELKPQEKRSVIVEYAIEHPNNKILVGSTRD